MIIYFFILVCESVLKKFEATVEDKDRSDKKKLESKLMKFCKDLKGKEERFVSIANLA